MFDARAALAPALPGWPRLLGDIGGTNARFGIASHPGAAVSQVRALPCRDHATLQDALQHYLSSLAGPAPVCAAFGIANPVNSDLLRMTNHHWAFSIEAVRAEFGWERLLLLNDFTALALALPTLSSAELLQIGAGAPVPGQPIALLGAGTGLGVSGLLPIGLSGKWLPLCGEGGHVTLSARTSQEAAVIEVLQEKFGHVSAERVLSGPGLMDLYQALRTLRAYPPDDVTTPAQVLALAGDYPSSLAAQVVEMFCNWLGTVAADLALTLGARGGVYIGGGIVPRLGEQFARSGFRQRFTSKGRFSSLLQEIPTYVIRSEISPALSGANLALEL